MTVREPVWLSGEAMENIGKINKKKILGLLSPAQAKNTTSGVLSASLINIVLACWPTEFLSLHLVSVKFDT